MKQSMHEGLVNTRDLSTSSKESLEQVNRGLKWRAISSGLLLHLKRAMRPKVRAGYDRVEWLCVS